MLPIAKNFIFFHCPLDGAQFRVVIGVFLTDMATSDNLTQYRGYIPMR